MLTKDNEFMKEAVQTLYECNSDALIQEQCRARETRLFFERSTQAKIEELNAVLAEKDEILAEKDAELVRLKTLLKEHNIEV